MAIGFHPREGDFIRVMAHRAQPRLRDMWWKVTEVKGDRLALINRHGHTAIWTGARTKFNIWQPGEPKNDGDLDYDA